MRDRGRKRKKEIERKEKRKGRGRGMREGKRQVRIERKRERIERGERERERERERGSEREKREQKRERIGRTELSQCFVDWTHSSALTLSYLKTPPFSVKDTNTVLVAWSAIRLANASDVFPCNKYGWVNDEFDFFFAVGQRCGGGGEENR